MYSFYIVVASLGPVVVRRTHIMPNLLCSHAVSKTITEAVRANSQLVRRQSLNGFWLSAAIGGRGSRSLHCMPRSVPRLTRLVSMR